jgi:hypothetical protein
MREGWASKHRGGNSAVGGGCGRANLDKENDMKTVGSVSLEGTAELATNAAPGQQSAAAL